MIDLDNIDHLELEKITLNKIIFSLFATDYLEIDQTLKVLGYETLPIEINTNNNKVFIRDLSSYMANNQLKPNIIEY
jgi:hypothetical protein